MLATKKKGGELEAYDAVFIASVPGQQADSLLQNTTSNEEVGASEECCLQVGRSLVLSIMAAGS